MTNIARQVCPVHLRHFRKIPIKTILEFLEFCIWLKTSFQQLLSLVPQLDLYRVIAFVQTTINLLIRSIRVNFRNCAFQSPDYWSIHDTIFLYELLNPSSFSLSNWRCIRRKERFAFIQHAVADL